MCSLEVSPGLVLVLKIDFYSIALSCLELLPHSLTPRTLFPSSFGQNHKFLSVLVPCAVMYCDLCDQGYPLGWHYEAKTEKKELIVEDSPCILWNTRVPFSHFLWPERLVFSWDFKCLCGHHGSATPWLRLASGEGQKRGKNYNRNSLYTLQLCRTSLPSPLTQKRASLLLLLLFMFVAQFCDSCYPGVNAGNKGPPPNPRPPARKLNACINRSLNFDFPPQSACRYFSQSLG